MKRLFDFTVALFVGVLSIPLMILVSILVRVKHGSPIFFKQPRPGLHGKIFNMYKFRTMTDAKDASGQLLSDEARLTRLGKILRKTSIDELPTLWNVLKGDMSLVGPRPLLVEYLPLYSERQARRHEVRPGITGWAQINGRNDVEWQEKLEMDVWYVENQSFFHDLRILFRTVFKVANQDGISKTGSATTIKFKGNG